MTSIYFLASSRPIEISQRLQSYEEQPLYLAQQRFSITDVYDTWYDVMQPLLTLPYLYEVRGLENDAFFMYLDSEMEVGDTLQLFYMHNQGWHENYVKRALEKQESIHINVGKLTYENEYGTFLFSKKNWINELRRRTLVTDRGVTTIVKYL